MDGLLYYDINGDYLGQDETYHTIIIKDTIPSDKLPAALGEIFQLLKSGGIVYTNKIIPVEEIVKAGFQFSSRIFKKK